MNFEEAYTKLREGRATDEEAAFVARELENVRRISSILDDPARSDPGISKAKLETVQKARKVFNTLNICTNLSLLKEYARGSKSFYNITCDGN